MSPGLRGKRKSCSVIVGFIEDEILDVATGMARLVAIVAKTNESFPTGEFCWVQKRVSVQWERGNGQEGGES